MKNDMLIQLHQTTGDLLQAISLFSQQQFNTIPFEGSWTAAQVTEHLFKAEEGAPQVLQGNSKTAERAPDEHVPMIEKIFLDFENKMKSPQFILPSPAEIIQDKEVRYQAFKIKRAEIEKAAGSMDFSLIYTDFEFPNLGSLSGVEWVTFLTTHAIRHIHQLKNIHKALG